MPSSSAGSRPKALLLDIDGTLLASNDAHARAWVAALGQHCHSLPFETVRPYIGKGGDKLLGELLGIDDESPTGKSINEARRALFSQKLLASLRPTKGSRALLERCRAESLNVVVATSASEEEVEALLRQAGVADLIRTRASSSDAGASKPDPDIVQAALEKAGLSPDRAVMLGDTPYDVQAAAQAGTPAIALRCGGWWDDAALSGAVAIYDDPADLLDHWAESPLGEKARLLADRGET